MIIFWDNKIKGAVVKSTFATALIDLSPVIISMYKIIYRQYAQNTYTYMENILLLIC